MYRLLLLMFFGWVGAANAAVINYQLPTYTFDDGGTVSGNFDWDDVALNVVDADITSSSGAAFGGASYLGGYYSSGTMFTFVYGTESGSVQALLSSLGQTKSFLQIENDNLELSGDLSAYLSTAVVREYALWVLDGSRPSAIGFGREDYRSTAPSAVPIPAAAWLFGSALLGLGVIKRRKAA